MIQSDALHPLRERGWRTGFGNLFHQENRKWWGTRRWLVYTLVWLVITNFILLMTHLEGEEVSSEEAMEAFIIPTAIFSIIGVVMTMQGVIIGEKQSGTAAWLLSKPVSRSAFILSRLLATWLAVLVIMIIIPSVAAFGLMTQLGGHDVALRPFVTSVTVLALFMTFLLTLTLMLGTFFNGRGPVIGIPLFWLFGAEFIQAFLARYAPALLDYDPMMLLELASDVALGGAVESATLIIATGAWSLLFIFVASWRFNREEF
jgi:ABC-2 type transport system permease protein